jgi:hypothetical protein
MSDEADKAAEYEQAERDAALRNHAARLRVLPMCEDCEEKPVHVTTSGLTWRYCPDCAEDHLRRNQAA